MRYAKPLVAVGLMVVVALPYVASFRAPIYAEEAAYAYVPWASQVTGQAFYNAAFENKTPGIFWLFQAVQGYDQPGVGRARLVQGALVWATALILLLWLSESVSLLAGTVAAFTFAFTVPTLVWWRTTVMAQTEPPMVLFTTLGFFLLYRGLRTSRSFWFILAGMALAGGFIFKQIAALELVASVVVVLLLTRDLPGVARWRRAGMVLGGFVLVAGALAVGMALTGQGASFWDTALMSLLRGSSHAMDIQACVWTFVGLVWFPAVAPLFLLATLPWLFGRRHATSSEAATPAFGRFQLARLLALWLIFAAGGFPLAGELLQRQMLPFFAPLAGLVGLGAVWLQAQWAGLSWSSRLARLLVIIAFTGLRWGLDYGTNVTMALRRDPAAQDPAVELGRMLGRYLPPGETLYSPDYGTLYLDARRVAPTRYFAWVVWEVPGIPETVSADLLRRRPGVAILSTSGRREEVREALRQEIFRGRYWRLGALPATPEHPPLEVYLRKDLQRHFPSPPWPAAAEIP
ncbi:MAG: hypothetical protein GX100_03505 [candidate division WS1 bacterium]|nr:hypothetical protein [candidate division WS1 bacterium]